MATSTWYVEAHFSFISELTDPIQRIVHMLEVIHQKEWLYTITSPNSN